MRVGMPRLARGLACRRDLTLGQSVRLALKVDFRVDVGRVERCMAEPGSHGVDVDARTEQMGGRRVTDAVRADSFGRERWCAILGPGRSAFDQCVDAEARDWLTTPIEEDMLLPRTIAHERA